MRKKLSPEEEALWKANMKGVKPLPKTSRPAVSPKPRPAPRPSSSRDVRDLSSLRAAPSPSPTFGKKTFRRTQAETRFDMHGLSLRTAPDILARFLLEAQNRGVKTVLVVTGKGAIGATNTLRHHLPQWLSEPPLCQLVCAFHHPAKIQDGGVGAFYLEIRKGKRV